MAHSVEMPTLGESVTEGTVTQWLKKVGDTVAVDEPLLEVSTDKVDTEVPSPVAGVLLKILAEEDETVDVGAVIAEIGEEGEQPSEGGDSGEGAGDSQSVATQDSADDASDEAAQAPAGGDSAGGSGSGEAEDVKMPELGESVTEGTITSWLKQVGDTVKVDEPLLEVSTDKVDTEVPSPVEGTLVEILAEEDDTVDVGAVIARIGDPNAATGGSSEGSGSAAKTSSPQDEADGAAQRSDAADNPKGDAGVGAQPDSPGAAAADTAAEEDAERHNQSESGSAGSSAGGSGSGGSGEAEDVKMPELGESVTEGTITSWLKQVGDAVKVDEPLLEVSTDKVDTEVPSPVEGTLVEILAEEDDTVDVGAVIARIGDPNAARQEPQADSAADDASADEADSSPKSAQGSADEQSDGEVEDSGKAASGAADSSAAQPAETSDEEAVASETPSGDKGDSQGEAPQDHHNLPYVTPLVRKLADKHGVDLSTVTGTGVGGRIRKQDVLAAAGDTPDGATSIDGQVEESAPQSTSAAGPRASTKKVDPAKQELRGKTIKVNRIRQITAKTTLDSLRATAQLTQVHEVDMTRVAELRSRSKKAFADKHGVHLTYLPFFAKAIVEALVSHPNVNASYNAETKEMTYHGEVHLGIAVDTEQGLLSPVIHNADKMTLPELAKAIMDIADRARSKKLRPDDLRGGTFTITNIGSEGALTDTPILVPPQAGMVGTGAIVKRPVVLNEDGADAIAIRQIVQLPLTYDHQVFDGADAGRFMTTVRDRLETADFEADLEL
ncbi:2-oxoglutarate dehydrogenase, E2 component, dihydrolipoamide succinyltransferase [Corynebacterium heidelbergense]|uniref:Dihydrolipoamide acetyltransferase component of pyruvate dehydrogenase complex n=1 Tax=Corynebacterium heidelbergense TaxID=2055947 RepID=A0A364V7Y0_9CORY|nr:2-oxoglutarate dehydrogenase, E2 component, dihydrolipoamide succinyltransferase [Corynebacterium heidelbergense]RAV32752.1 pyruvate dehydrogenase complex dihydrolipoyllysine-residue acetyltransferase [Corynebacterium heidelbergense]